MPQPSLTSDPGGLLSELLARGPVRSLTSDGAWLGAMVEAEIALARASASVGLIPAAHAAAIERIGRGLSLDVAAIGHEAATSGTPIVALVRRIRDGVGDDIAPSVHRGATSQDVVDTAMMMIAQRALDAIVGDLGGASDAAARLAHDHRMTPLAGRTLLQQASPTTFGLKAAVWMSGLDRATRGLEDVRTRGLAVQLGGAVGTLAAFDGEGRSVVRAFADRLGLGVPSVPWHSERTRIGQLAGALGVAAGAVGKPARDIVLLAQTEVGEVAEGVAGRGSSSTLPHKHNPVAAVAAIASAQRAPGLVVTLLASMDHEHERAAGNWQAEWIPLRDLLVAVGSAATWLRDCLEHLVVRPEAMRRNLAATGGTPLAERVVQQLTATLGRKSAEDLVAGALEDAAGGSGFIDALIDRDDRRSGLDRAACEALLDPSTYLGEAPGLVDDALRAHLDGRPA
jgi:3-carboxy-cis,cis-muconate cycloisomerase